MTFGNRSSDVRRTGSVLSSLVLIFIICLSALPVAASPTRPRKQHPRPSTGKSRKAKSQNLSKITARRGSPVAKRSEEGRRERTDQPDKAMKVYREQRLPKGATELPVERYFEAKAQMKSMPRYSTAQGAVLPSENDT